MSKTSVAIGSIVAVLLGAATWMIWCGFDTTYYPEGSGEPYTTWQVVGCGITFLVLTGALAYRYSSARSKFLASLGVGCALGVGFWLAWTIQAALTDDSGLFAVGAILLAPGLCVGTALGVAIGVTAKQSGLGRKRSGQRA